MQGNDAIKIVVGHLSAKGLEANPQKRAAIGGYAKRLLDGGATEDQVKRWADHYGLRLAEGSRIRPSQAWDDVISGADGGVQANGNGSNIPRGAAATRTVEDRKKAADARIKQAMDKGLIKSDPRRPLTKEEKKRFAKLDEELELWRSENLIGTEAS